MSEPHEIKPASVQQLCLACGMCCNGVLFSGVKLQPGDDPARLKALGLRLCASEAARTAFSKLDPDKSHRSPGPRFRQPCSALEGQSCRIYSERPRYCREFECMLLKSLRAGTVRTSTAFETVRKARNLTQTVRYLLNALGDTDESRPLRQRFNRTAARLNEVGLDQPTSEIYGKLTLAMHDLNFLLCDSFYPGS